MKLDLQDRRLWIAGAAMAGLLVVAVAWLLVIGPMRSNTEQVNSQADAAATHNAELIAQNAALERDRANLPEYRAQLAKALNALPPQADLSGFTQLLSLLAKDTGVTLSSVSVGGVQAATTTPTATATTAASGTSSTTPAAAATSAAPSQLIANITVQVKGTTATVLRFLEAVRIGRRSALISSTQLTRTNGNAELLTAQLQVFSAPVSTAQLAQLRALLTASK